MSIRPKEWQAEFDANTAKLSEMLGREGFGGVLINGQHNFAWLTGGANNAVDLSRESGVASILVTREGSRHLLANNIEMRRLIEEEFAGSTDQMDTIEFPWQDEKSSASRVADYSRRVVNGTLVSDIPLFDGVRAVDGLISPIRQRLSNYAKQLFRSLGQDVAGAVRRTISSIKQGDTEIEIAAKLRFELGRSDTHSIVTLVAADERISAFRHPVPTAKPVENTVMVVTCARRNGLVANMTRIACFGRVPAELEERTAAAAFVNSRLLAATRPGSTGAELYRTAADAYRECGFPAEIDRHHQGGAAGYRPREWVAHPESREVVQPDQAFAWNPSITGTKTEDTVIFSNDTVETITRGPDEPVITHTVAETVYNSTGIVILK